MSRIIRIYQAEFQMRNIAVCVCVCGVFWEPSDIPYRFWAGYLWALLSLSAWHLTALPTVGGENAGQMLPLPHPTGL